jgi:hypothetical protein
MAVGSGRFLRQYHTNLAQKELEEKLAEQRRKESQFGGFLALLTPLLAIATGGISTAMTGVAGFGGGILGTAASGLVTAGLKGVVEKTLRDTGSGGKGKDVITTGRYGIGRGVSKKYGERMDEGIAERAAFNPESILTDVLMSYIGDFIPKISKEGVEFGGGKLTENIREHGLFSKEAWFGEMGDVGLLGKKVGGLKGLKAAFGGERGMKEALASFDKELFEGSSLEPIDTRAPYTEEFGGETLAITPPEFQDQTILDTLQTSITPTVSTQVQPTIPSTAIQDTGFGTSTQLQQHYGRSGMIPPIGSGQDPTWMQEEVSRQAATDEEGWSITDPFNLEFQQGGQVPKTLLDFFAMQGKTLDGSNKKSLAEMLGRK